MDQPASDCLTAAAAPVSAAVPAQIAPVFPLPLSEFEDYMLCDDSPSHPMVIVMLADVSGTLLEPQFRQSVASLLQRQPLLRSRIVSANGQNAWQPVSPAPDPVTWLKAEPLEPTACFPNVQPLDVRSGQCLRIHVWFSTQCSRVCLELHHSCADGIAAVQLIHELFTEYASLTGPSNTRQTSVGTTAPPEELLLHRSPLGRTAATDKSRSTPLTLLPGKIARLLFRRPAQIADSAQRGSSPSLPVSGTPQQAIRVCSLAAPTLQKLRTRASEQGAALNDLLLREIFLHTATWNLEARVGRPSHWIRIAVPISMRDPRSAPLPACNLVSYALVTHRIRECDDPALLLRKIQQKTSTMRSGKDGIIALRILRVLRHVPGGVRAFLRCWPCAGTLVLANVGHVIRRCHSRLPIQQDRWLAGNVIVERICGVPPVRPNTLAAFGLTEYAGQLHISLRTDGTRMTPDDSEDFLMLFVRRLEKLVSEP
ncbi:MAG: hypothetical protein RL215_3200 [Planctomycetota bacterium]|jgi:hypothetical protein